MYNKNTPADNLLFVFLIESQLCLNSREIFNYQEVKTTGKHFVLLKSQVNLSRVREWFYSLLLKYKKMVDRFKQNSDL